jgi:glycosyltransferase involved in cell wall biosynthesis
MISLSTYPGDPRIRREAEVLGENGISVDIICLARDGESYEESFGLIRAYRILKIAKKERIFSYLTFSLSFFMLAFLRLQKLYIQNRYSIVQFHNMPDYLVFLGIIQKMLGAKIILDIHDLTPELFEEKWPQKKDKFLHRLIKFVEILSCKFSNEIITVTDECKRRLVHRGISDNKITLVLNTPPKKIFLYDENRIFHQPNNKLRLLYHGTVAKRFGLHLAIESVSIIKNQISDLKLFIYGKYDSDYKSELINLIQELGLDENIELGDFITLEEVYAIIKKCDIAVVPYLETDYMHLSLSTKTFEYAAAGIPVVCTKLSEMHNIFGDECIFFVDSLSPQTIANAICDAYQNPEKRKQFVINASKALDKISGEKMRQKYFNLISRNF